MKKLLSVIFAILISLSLSACREKQPSGDKDTVIRIGATPVPHVDILKEVETDLKEKGITLEIVTYTDYPLINKALIEKEIDANFFQHIPYLEDFEKNGEGGAEILGGIHVEPMGIYSKKYKSLDELQDGDEVMIPNDTTNSGRPLLLLQSKGILKLKDGAGIDATELDIEENPKNLKFKRMDAAAIPSTYGDAAIAAINGNFALEHGLNPLSDAIVLEDAASPYVNIIAVRKGEKDLEKFKLLLEALQSEKIKVFILEKYQGAVIPAF